MKEQSEILNAMGYQEKNVHEESRGRRERSDCGWRGRDKRDELRDLGTVSSTAENRRSRGRGRAFFWCDKSTAWTEAMWGSLEGIVFVRLVCSQHSAIHRTLASMRGDVKQGRGRQATCLGCTPSGWFTVGPRTAVKRENKPRRRNEKKQERGQSASSANQRTRDATSAPESELCWGGKRTEKKKKGDAVGAYSTKAGKKEN